MKIFIPYSLNVEVNKIFTMQTLQYGAGIDAKTGQEIFFDMRSGKDVVIHIDDDKWDEVEKMLRRDMVTFEKL